MLILLWVVECSHLSQLRCLHSAHAEGPNHRSHRRSQRILATLRCRATCHNNLTHQQTLTVEVLELQQHNLYIKYAYAESQILFQLVTIFCVHVLLLKAGHMAEILHCCSSHWPRQSQIIKSGQTLFSQRKGLNFIWPPNFSLHLRF